MSNPEALKPYRKKRSAANVVSERAERIRAPYSAMVEIADRCNEACVHCYQVQGQKGELDTAEWKRIFGELAEMGVMFLTISGGEPTLRKDFMDLVAHARRLRFAVKIYSNALNINEAMAREFGRLAVQEVQISLYSHRPEVHDQVTRVPGSFEHVVAATRHLRAAGVKVLLKSPLLKHNASEFSDYVDLVTSLGADYALDPHLSPREDGDPGPTRLGATKHEYFAVKRDPRFRAPRDDERPRPPQRDKGGDRPCGACSGNVHIEANGELRPCTQWGIPTGHASQEGVRAAWEQDPAARAIRDLTWSDLPLCRTCDLQAYCQRCFADAERLSGNAVAPYARACRGARWQYELAHGVEPEIDSSNDYCEAEPVGPFERNGEHRFLTRASTSGPGSTPMRPWLGPADPNAAPAALERGQLVQLRRRANGPFTQLAAPPSDLKELRD